MSYQGWTNAATWATALCIDNDRVKLKEALSLAPRVDAEVRLRWVCETDWQRDVRATASWAFREPTNYAELIEHYRAKLKEGASA